MNPSSSSASTLRPRARRLISGLDDEPITDPYSSRPASHPSSSNSSPNRRGAGRLLFDAAPVRNVSSLQPPQSLAGAWNQFQGFATNLLSGNGSSSPGKRKLRWNTTSKMHTSSAEWGPNGRAQDQIGAGYNDDRVSLVRDAKRKVLLSGSGYHSAMDGAGRHKRKTSDDLTSTSMPPPGSADADALVYIHRVQPEDTLAGLTIKYNCQVNILRKANRMWPNDPIQSRKTIVIPVDVCTVKGKPVSGSEGTKEIDLLQDENITMHESPDLSKTPPLNGRTTADLLSTSSPHFRTPSPDISQSDSEPPWKHDSWVLLPNDSKPTEVARLSRQNLGYFPRARRKSISFSDIGTSRTTSFDLTRPPNPISPSLLPTRTPVYTSPSRRPAIGTRVRSSSNTMSNLLHGPGGVGTLGRNSRVIGPETDRLTELLAPHLPNVAPPSHQTVFTPWAPGLLEDAEGDNLSRSGTGVSLEGTSASGLDFQEMGGAIEGWVRKMAKKASTALETNAAASTTRAKGNVGVQGLGLGSGMGDLIELVDAFEIGDGEPEASDPNSVLIDTTTGDMSSSNTSFAARGDAAGEIRGRKLARPDNFANGRS